MKLIRNLILVAACCGAAALGGCAPGGSVGGVTLPTVQQVQDAAVTACSFLPTTATVANIIGTVAGHGAETQLATTIAAQICAAVSPTVSARRGGAAPTVTNNGVSVVVHGRFVK